METAGILSHVNIPAFWNIVFLDYIAVNVAG
jgi:hypothetical protein